MNVLSLSQGSNVSDSTTDDGEEARRQNVVDNMLANYCKKQRKQIKELNRNIENISKVSTAILTDVEEKSLGILNQNMEAIQAYYNESQESTAGLVNTTVMQLSEICETMIAKLNEVSHKVDPYDAEETEVHLAQHYSDSIRQINRWRRQIVKDNYNEMKKHQSSVQSAVNAEEVAKATMVLMKANSTI